VLNISCHLSKSNIYFH